MLSANFTSRTLRTDRTKAVENTAQPAEIHIVDEAPIASWMGPTARRPRGRNSCEPIQS